MLVKNKQKISSPEKDSMIKEKNANSQNCNGENNKYG